MIARLKKAIPIEPQVCKYAEGYFLLGSAFNIRIPITTNSIDPNSTTTITFLLVGMIIESCGSFIWVDKLGVMTKVGNCIVGPHRVMQISASVEPYANFTRAPIEKWLSWEFIPSVVIQIKLPGSTG